MKSQTLPRFFTEMTSFLRGASDLDTLVSLGGSPSKREQFLWYRTMVQTNPDRLLESVYDIVKFYAGDDVFMRCCKEHLQSQEPGHWDIARLALGFGASVEKIVNDDDAISVAVTYLADWEELLFRLRTFERAPMPRDGLNPTVEVRQYTHDVRGYRNAVRKGKESVMMEERDVIYLAYRQVETSRLKIYTPSVPELLLVAFGLGELSVEEFQNVNLPDETIKAALAGLKNKQLAGADFVGPKL